MLLELVGSIQFSNSCCNLANLLVEVLIGGNGEWLMRVEVYLDFLLVDGSCEVGFLQHCPLLKWFRDIFL